MKKLLLIFLLIPVLASSQWLEMGKQKIGNKVGIQSSGVYQWALDFDGSTEYLSCTPALRLTGEYSAVYPSITGDTSFACSQVYGSWTFTVNKTGDNDIVDLYFINDLNSLSGNSGYLFKYGNDEKMYLYSVASETPTARITSSGTYAIGNNHTVVITRNTNGAFTMTANGTSVGTVTNATYTNSNYCFTDYTGTAQITSLSFQQGEGSLNLNSYERIYHSDNRSFTKTGGFAWTGAGTHSIDTTSTDKRTGTHSGKLISTDVGDSTTNYISLPAVNFDTLKTDANSVYEKYTLEGWARGVGIPSNVTLGAWTNSPTNPIDTFTTGDSSNITNLYSSATTDLFYQNIGTYLAGDIYVITFTAVRTSGTFSVYLSDANNRNPRSTNYPNSGTFSTSGAFTFYLTALSSSNNLCFASQLVPCQFSITNITVKKLTLPSITLKIGNQTKTVTGISCVPSTFTKFVFNFQSNALVSNQPILLYLNQADTVYLDDVSLTKGYDILTNQFINSNSTTPRVLGLSALSGSNTRYAIYTNNATLFSSFYYDGTTFSNFSSTLATLTNGTTYKLLNQFINKTSVSRTYANGNSLSADSTNALNVGKVIIPTLNIGFAASINYFLGTLGHIQITKFTDISQSNVNSTTLTTAYNRGKLIQGEWTGGSPIEVAFYDWKGSDITEILRDKSGAGNNLTGTNMDINDRVKVKSKFK